MLTTILSVALLASSPEEPRFVSFQNGNALYSKCNASAATEAGRLELAGCMVYILGVTDAHSAIEQVRLNAGGYRRTTCIPTSASAIQIVDVVQDFLRTHPAERHAGAASLVIGALAETFPCS